MKDGTAKQYFKKLNTTIEGLNKVDGFAKQFTNLLNRSDLELYLKERREKRIFDDSWMEDVEQIIPVIDKLTRNPRETLKKIYEILPVERAKKIDSDTIRHLASHSENIKERDRYGNVIPSKVLTSYYDQDLGTYENRFLMSLVNKLYIFIELRYNLIIEKMNTEYANLLKVKSSISWMKTNIDYDITLNIHREIDDDDLGQKNRDLLERMTYVRRSITNFKMSNFMQDMKGFAPVRSPIMMTNILRKNVDFNQCYKMWVLLDKVDRIGYETDTLDRNVLVEEQVQTEIKNALMILYATVSNNQVEDLNFNQPMNFLREKKAKILERVDHEDYLEPGDYVFDDHRVNQYFLDKIKDVNVERFKTLNDVGINKLESIKIIYQRMQEVVDNAFRDFIDEEYKPEEVEDIRERVELQNEVLTVYREVEKIKIESDKEFRTNKALALLNFRNYRDEFYEIEDAEKLEAIKAEQQKQDTQFSEMKKIVQDKEYKEQKLKEAQRILEEAEAQREKEKKQKQKKKNKR